MEINKPRNTNRQQQNASGFQYEDTGTSSNSHLGEAASELINESKKKAWKLYEEGKTRIHQAQNNIKEYSNQLATQVQQKPFLSLLVAGGIGFLLSALFRKN